MSFILLARTSFITRTLRPNYIRSLATNAAMLNTISEIKVDHNNIKDLYMRYKDESDHKTRSAIVNTIIREIAVHSEAEEATVYNSLGQQSESDAKAMRDEHQELEEVLYSVDYTKIDNPEFGPKFDHAIKLFLQHSAEEEEAPGTLLKLSQSLSAEDNDALAKKFLQYRDLVPTRPHPMAPQSGSTLHKALGALTKAHDKVFETLTGRSFVDLKFTHNTTANVESLKVPEKYLM